MNSSVIICPFHSVPAVNSTLLIHLCVLAQIYEADLVIGGGSPASEALLSHYGQAWWGILRALVELPQNSCWGALFKQSRAVLPNLMGTPSPGPTLGSSCVYMGVICSSMSAIGQHTGLGGSGSEKKMGLKIGNIRPLNVGEEQISFIWLLAQLTDVLVQLTDVLEWEWFCGPKRKPANIENEGVNIIMKAMVCRISKDF